MSLNVTAMSPKQQYFNSYHSKQSHYKKFNTLLTILTKLTPPIVQIKHTRPIFIPLLKQLCLFNSRINISVYIKTSISHLGLSTNFSISIASSLKDFFASLLADSSWSRNSFSE